MRSFASYLASVALLLLQAGAAQKTSFLTETQIQEIATNIEQDLHVSGIASCISASCILHPKQCITSLPSCIVSQIGHGEDSDSWFGSGFSMIQDWFLGQTGSKSITGAVTDIVKQCLSLKAQDWLGKSASLFSKVLPEQGPYDSLVCDIVGGASKDGFNLKNVSVGHIGSCTSASGDSSDARRLVDFLEAAVSASTSTLTTPSPASSTSALDANADCSEQTFGINGFKDFFSQAWATVKKDDENSGIIGDTFTSLKACWSDKATPKTSCMGAVFVGMACSSSCDLIDCEVRKLYANGDQPCRKALKASCSAAFASANKLCATILAKATINTTQTCTTAQTCKSLNAAAPLAVPLALWTALVTAALAS